MSVKDRWAQLARSAPWRAWTRYANARGDLLAAGVAYFSFFSLFPAFALAAVVFGFVLRSRPDLLEALGDALNRALPGFVRTATNPDGLVALAAPETATLSWAGAVAFVTLVLGGLGWIGSLRDGLRAVFDVPGAPGNPVLTKLRDLGVLALLGILLLVSVALSSVVGAAAAWGAERLGMADYPYLVGSGGVVVSLVIDSAIMVVLLRVLTGLSLPWRAVRAGALVGGGGMTLLKLVGAQVVARATSNPVFGSIVVVVGLLFWLNLLAKVVLVAAAWSANDYESSDRPSSTEVPLPEPDQLSPSPSPSPLALALADGRIEAADPRARAAHGIPLLGARSRDRVTLTAGAILGGVATAGLGALGRLARSLRQRS